MGERVSDETLRRWADNDYVPAKVSATAVGRLARELLLARERIAELIAKEKRLAADMLGLMKRTERADAEAACAWRGRETFEDALGRASARLALAEEVIAAARSGGIRCQCEWIGLDRVSVCPLCDALRRYDEGSGG